jgi:hypothetical protein
VKLVKMMGKDPGVVLKEALGLLEPFLRKQGYAV